MTFADKLIELRRQNSLSQEALAEKLDISRQAISRWETGAAMPDAQNLLLMSKLFGVTVDYLINEECQAGSTLQMEEISELYQIKQKQRNTRNCTRALLISTVATLAFAAFMFLLFNCLESPGLYVLIPLLTPLPLLYLSIFHHESLNRTSVLVVSLISLLIVTGLTLLGILHNVYRYNYVDTFYPFTWGIMIVHCDFASLIALSIFIPALSQKKNWMSDLFSFLISSLLSLAAFWFMGLLGNLFTFLETIIPWYTMASHLIFIISWYFLYSERKQKNEKM